MSIKVHCQQKEVDIQVGEITLQGILSLPEHPKGLVLFAHGSGSSRHSSRNQFVAKILNEGHHATLLMDLLTPDEEAVDNETRHLRFNIPMLANRLIGATEWIKQQASIKDLSLGYFGSSTGAAAALIAAASIGTDIKAVVSRGGRPDLAFQALSEVKSPTLLIVGGYDYTVIELNKQALAQMTVERRIEIVPRATHLFEEPGALEEAARLANEWFSKYL